MSVASTPDRATGAERAPAHRDWRAIDWARHTHTIELDGGRVSYADFGDGAGPPVLLVHGLGGEWTVWLETIPDLALSRRVIAVDLPGFGASPLGPDAPSIDGAARMLATLCAALELDSVVVAGSSLGGWIAAELALQQPDLVRALVLIGAAGISPTRWERAKTVSVMWSASRVAPLGSRFRRPIAARPRLRRMALGFTVDRADRLPADLVYRCLPEAASEGFRPYLKAAIGSWSFEWSERLRTLERPALVVWGERDGLLPVRHGREWERLLPDADLVVVPGAGHLPMLERPQVVNQLLARFTADID